jgi:hypothetical protein
MNKIIYVLQEWDSRIQFTTKVHHVTGSRICIMDQTECHHHFTQRIMKNVLCSGKRKILNRKLINDNKT